MAHVAIPPAVPRQGGPLSRAIGRVGLALLGWQMQGELPREAKFVAIVAPHSSNWDFVVGLLAKYAIGVRASFLGKHTLFRWPFGALFRHWGGIPVIRDTSHDVVEQSVAEFARRDALVLAIAPAGTRKPVARWRTGFYHIAHGAGVPILLVALDWSRKTVRFGPTMRTTGDVGADMAWIQAEYVDVHGRHRRSERSAARLPNAH
jgi:1-acyl-sn-glycerol-3-phosphate acyltransferase